MHIQKRITCLFLEDSTNPVPANLLQAVASFNSQVKPILLSHKNFKVDLERIRDAIQDACAVTSIQYSQRIIYDGARILSTFITHTDSREQYEVRRPLSTIEPQIKIDQSPEDFAKIQSLLNIFGLSTVDEDSYFIPQEIKDKVGYQISHSDIVSFKKCAVCFIISKKYKYKRPYKDDAFPIQNATDEILKHEFDLCREAGVPHQLMKMHNIDAVPFNHKDSSLWKNSDYGRGGVQIYNESRNLIVKGTPDDVWINSKGQLILVEIKTVKSDIDIDEVRAQLSLYASLFTKLGFPVLSEGYLLVNRPTISKATLLDIITKREGTDAQYSPFQDTDEYSRQLTFVPELISVKIDNSWIGYTLDDMANSLSNDEYAKQYKKNTNQACFACDTHGIRDSILHPQELPDLDEEVLLVTDDDF